MQNEKKTDLKSLLPKELEAFISNLGQPAYRAKQLFKWLHSGARSFDEMTNLPQSFRDALAGVSYVSGAEVVSKQVSADGTIKYLFELADGSRVESVVMEYSNSYSICISTQVGCRMGCLFCASTLGGLIRNLSASEMLDQILFASKESGRRLSNVVLMGIGEPLDNFENLTRFLELVKHEDGLFIGHRHISVSTCGLCHEIDRLAELKYQITLSVSLHSPFDAVRKKIMPGAARYSISELLQACDRYFEKTKRRISFEYTMMAGINDREEDSRELIRLFRGKPCHINLITLNPVSERDIKPSSANRMAGFARELEAGGLSVTRRRRLGADISAACGQLRREKGATGQTE